MPHELLKIANRHPLLEQELTYADAYFSAQKRQPEPCGERDIVVLKRLGRTPRMRKSENLVLCTGLAACALLFASGSTAFGQSYGATVGVAPGQTASPSPEIRIDSSSEAVFLSMIFGGGDTGLSTRYQFFGDGRVEIGHFAESSEPYARQLSQLTDFDLDEVVGTIVDNRLYAFDPDALLEMELREGVRRRSGSEAGFAIVQISVLQSTGDPKHPWTSVSNKFTVQGSILALDDEPVVREFEALKHLLKLSHEARDRGRRL
ncbi:MAG: hypothetical protein ABI639_09175 [Thermoanaerobaculia bacterium]